MRCMHCSHHLLLVLAIKYNHRASALARYGERLALGADDASFEVGVGVTEQWQYCACNSDASLHR